MKQKTRFKSFGNISADISVSASKKPYRSISSVHNSNLTRKFLQLHYFHNFFKMKNNLNFYTRLAGSSNA